MKLSIETMVSFVQLRSTLVHFGQLWPIIPKFDLNLGFDQLRNSKVSKPKLIKRLWLCTQSKVVKSDFAKAYCLPFTLNANNRNKKREGELTVFWIIDFNVKLSITFLLLSYVNECKLGMLFKVSNLKRVSSHNISSTG